MDDPLINKVLHPPPVTWGRWLGDLVGLFMPPLCSACDRGLMPFERALCLDCLRDLPLARFGGFADNPVAQRFRGRVRIEAASALLRFVPGGKVQRVLHRLKYANDERAGLLLGRLMAEDILRCGRFATVDAIVPVPLHPRRKRQRGYNQSEVLARGMREAWDVPVRCEALTRAVRTATQTRRGRIERWSNVRTAFTVPRPAEVQGRHLLLVDDVVTTGATIEACATALLAVPGARVSVYTAAFA
ncbi:MAG: ComF family protein [Flavobacteriales bacterium]|jgi:ComF family protein|nr:ComF family protein [Flavobacteriales bacterium]